MGRLTIKEVDSGTLTATARQIGPQGNDYTLVSDNANSTFCLSTAYSPNLPSLI